MSALRVKRVCVCDFRAQQRLLLSHWLFSMCRVHRCIYRSRPIFAADVQHLRPGARMASTAANEGFSTVWWNGVL